MMAGSESYLVVSPEARGKILEMIGLSTIRDPVVVINMMSQSFDVLEREQREMLDGSHHDLEKLARRQAAKDCETMFFTLTVSLEPRTNFPELSIADIDGVLFNALALNPMNSQKRLRLDFTENAFYLFDLSSGNRIDLEIMKAIRRTPLL